MGKKREIWFRRESWGGIPGIQPANWKGLLAFLICGGAFVGLQSVGGKHPSYTEVFLGALPLFVLIAIIFLHCEPAR
jgi:hypothetical protein